MNKEDRVLELHERTKRTPLSGELDPGYGNTLSEEMDIIKSLNRPAGSVSDFSNFPFVEVTIPALGNPIQYYWNQTHRKWYRVFLSDTPPESMVDKIKKEQRRISYRISELERQKEAALRNDYHDVVDATHLRIGDHETFKSFLIKLEKEL